MRYTILAGCILIAYFLNIRGLQADILYRQGHVDQAITLNPDEPAYHLGMADACLATGHPDCYRQELALARSKDPYDILLQQPDKPRPIPTKPADPNTPLPDVYAALYHPDPCCGYVLDQGLWQARFKHWDLPSHVSAAAYEACVRGEHRCPA